MVFLPRQAGDTIAKPTRFYERRCNSHFIGSVSKSNAGNRINEKAKSDYTIVIEFNK
jgi:hypothetical protein